MMKCRIIVRIEHRVIIGGHSAEDREEIYQKEHTENDQNAETNNPCISTDSQIAGVVPETVCSFPEPPGKGKQERSVTILLFQRVT